MVACVVSFIAGGYGVRDAGVDGGLDRIVQSGRGSTLEAHVRDGGEHAILADPIDGGDDAAVSAVAIAIEHSDGVQRGAFGHAVGRSAHDAGDVGPVAIAIVRAVAIGDRRVRADGPAAEVHVRSADPCVDDVHVHPGPSCRVGVGAAQRQRPLVDPVESPRRVWLDVRDLHPQIGLDERDVRVARKRVDRVVRQVSRESFDGAGISMAQPATVLFHELSCQSGRILRARLEDDDVAVRDDVARQRGEVERRVGRQRFGADRRGWLLAAGRGNGNGREGCRKSDADAGPPTAGSAQTDPLRYVRQPDRHGARASMRAGCSLEALRPRLSTGLPLSRSPKGCDCAVTFCCGVKLACGGTRLL